jgi:putative RecB family exonuclease
MLHLSYPQEAAAVIRLSATRLVTYDRCPKQYQLKYHHRLGSTPVKPAVLGTALHWTLAGLYRRPAVAGKPDLGAVNDLWREASEKHHLDAHQSQAGTKTLDGYWRRYIEPLSVWKEPVAVEGRVEAELQANQLAFRVVGRFDLLINHRESNAARLELIDFKTGKQAKAVSQLETDLQLGLYQFAIDQRYGQALAALTHRYLKDGDQLGFTARPEQKEVVREKISRLAVDLVNGREFGHRPGEHCRRCPVKDYCPEVSAHPLPVGQPAPMRLQLSLC